jgi:HEAT repeat protein
MTTRTLALLTLAGSLITLAPAQADQPKPAAPGAFNPASDVQISSLRERSIGVLTEMLTSQAPELRANALEGLLLAPQRLEQAVSAGLKDQSIGVRTVAALAVGKAKLNKLLPEVKPLLGEKNEFIQMGAIFAFAKCGSNVNQSPLAGFLLQGESPKIKAQAAFILGELGNRSALGLLRDASKMPMGRSDPNEDRLMRLQIAEAMVKLGDESAINEIRAALYPASPDALEAFALATQILGQLRDRNSVASLIEVTQRRDGGANANANTGNALPAEIRLGAAASLSRMGHDATFVADELIRSVEPPIRAQCAYVIGESRKRENLAKLIPLLDDASQQVRISAATAALKIIDGEPAPK